MWTQPIGVRADRKSTPTPTSTPPPLIKNGSRDLPEAALTFDACPERGFDTDIIRVLTETQAPATFFLSGWWMKSHISDTQLLASIPLRHLMPVWPLSVAYEPPWNVPGRFLFL